MVNENKILYVSKSCFPNMASGVRVTNITKLLQNNGYNVTMYSSFDIEYIPKQYREQLNVVNQGKFSVFNYDACKYLYNQKKSNTFINKIISYLENFLNFNLIKNIKKLCIDENIRYVILYNPLYNVSKKVYKFCKKNNIKLIIDNTEWYQVTGKFIDKYIAKSVNKRILNLDKRINNIISISPWMDNWYKDRGINSICVLPLMECFKEPVKDVNSKFIHLVYCGVPGKKDLLIPIINGIKKVNSKINKFKVTIIGVTSQYFGDEDLEKYNIYCLGKISREQVFEHYNNANFSCLFRNDARYAKAGFSTKVAESLSFGVPVLCNIVGGTDDIIEDGYNGFKIKNIDEDSVESMLLKISTLDCDQLFDLRLNAYNCGKILFGMDKYENSLKEFLNK